MSSVERLGHVADTAQRSLAFSVDTHLLRQLGTLLVGRDSTALVELIKNAYDADASSVTIHGEQLAEHGYISIRDDGHGMTYDEFENKFLRIAGRSKDGGERRSPLFGRRFTGAKGIGRLAANKLGHRLTLESTPDLSVASRDSNARGFSAIIDFSALEQNTNSIDQAKNITANPGLPASPTAKDSGTLLTISDLDRAWNARQLNQFLSEVRSTRPDGSFYLPINAKVAADPLMLPDIKIADIREDESDFNIEMSGEFAGTETQWPTLVAQMNWIVEIDALQPQITRVQITPTTPHRKRNPEISGRSFSWARAGNKPLFTARIFIRDTRANEPRLPDLLNHFAGQASGVRVYMEGFRVLPYGSAGNDWLELDRKSSRREGIVLSDELLSGPKRKDVDERTYQLANRNHFGAVFLREEHSGGLEMVINREGFTPSPAFDHITETVQQALNLSTRLRASFGAHEAVKERAQRQAGQVDEIRRIAEQMENPQGQPPSRALQAAASAVSPRDRVGSLVQVGREAVAALRAPDAQTPASSAQALAVLQATLTVTEEYLSSDDEERAQLRVLASLGTQLGAFIHEMNSLVGQARGVRDLVQDLLNGVTDAKTRRQLQDVLTSQNEVLGTLERQAVYLSDTLGAEARRRRSRQRVKPRLISAMRLLSSSAERRGVQVHDDLEEDLRTLPMYPAELSIIFTNLLSNAIKAAAAGDPQGERLIRISGRNSTDEVVLRVENTGVRVDVADGERWFRPFETTTAEADLALGQGLGLGLPLTRRIIEEYGGTVEFVAPSAAFATAIQVLLPRQKNR